MKRSGTQPDEPDDSDVLNRCVRYGESRSIQSFRSHVGVGSRLDCLAGAQRTSLMTSSQLRGVNRCSDDCDCTSLNIGGDAPSVGVRIDVTFDSKKSAKSFAVREGLAALGLSRHKMASMDRHNSLALACESVLERQYSLRFWSTNLCIERSDWSQTDREWSDFQRL